MASEMVEGVAKAIGRQISGGDVSLGKRHDSSENGWIQAARAAIEAMREPTDKMEAAGWESDEAEFGPPSYDLKEAWRLMIDEALKE